jgi:uncharacterized protein YcbK (DUF882 family)
MISRRRFLAGLALGMAGTAQAEIDFWSLPRTLWMRRLATGEEARVTYWRDGNLDPVGYWHACNLLRDVQAGKIVQMDLGLLNLLRAIQGWFAGYGLDVRLDILSGYRTPETNERTEGAALNSAHMSATAADFRIERVPAAYLGRLALHFAGGGVGFYLQRDFIHADVLRRRMWIGR